MSGISIGELKPSNIIKMTKRHDSKIASITLKRALAFPWSRVK